MTSRIIFCSLCLTFILAIDGLCIRLVHAGQESFPFIGVSTSDQVNVRAGQSANFERLCQLKKNEEVVVIAKEFGWYKIQLPLQAKSFVSKDYVQYLGQNAGGITANDVNIRSGAGIHYTILGQLSKGEQIYIQDELEEWYRIEPVAKSFGWVAEEYLKFKSHDIHNREVVPRQILSIQRDLPEQTIEADEQPTEMIEESYIIEDKPKMETGIDIQKDVVGEESSKIKKDSDFKSNLSIADQGVISVSGYVEPYEKKGKDGIYFKIVSNGEPVCYIQGVNHLLGRFIHQQVKVDGTVNQKLLSQYSRPVIVVLKVRLML